jgi:ketosteroid isomerase-like protein
MRTYAIAASLTCLLACNSATHQAPVVDPVTALESMLTADREFSALSLKEGMNVAFLTYAADDGVMLRPGSMPVEGREKLHDRLAARPDTTFTLTWEPLRGQVAGSGDMGFTYGTYTLRYSPKPQDTLTERGTYVTVWKKDSLDRWRMALDSGNPGLGDAGQ